MFICKNCKSVDKFELMFDPSYKGKKLFFQETDKEGHLVFKVDGYSFRPDLDFMNQHAVCRFCGQIYIWDYSK